MADVRHEPEALRFVVDVDGKTGVIQYRRLDGGILDFFHTYVPPPLRGAGIASQLTAHALGYAREHGYAVVPSCPFVAAFIRRHPEHRDLVAQAPHPE